MFRRIIFATIWTYKWLLILPLVLLPAMTFIAISKSPPIYQSEGKMIVRENQKIPTVAGQGPKILMPKTFIEEQAEVLLSDRVLTELDKRIHAGKDPEERHKRIAGLRPAIVPEIVGPEVMSIVAESSTAERAREILQELMVVYKEEALAMKLEEFVDVEQFLNKEYENRREILKFWESELAKFRESVGSQMIDVVNWKRGLASYQNLSDIVREKDNAEINIAVLKKDLEGLKSDPILRESLMYEDILGVEASVTVIFARLARLRMELKNMNVRLTENNRLVNVLEEEISFVEKLGASELKRLIAVKERELNELEQKTGLIDETAERYRSNFVEISRLAMELDRMNWEYEQAKDAVKRVTMEVDKVGFSKATETMEAAWITVLNPASWPKKPISPTPKPTILASFILAILVGLGLIYLRSVISPVYLIEDQLNAEFELPVLATTEESPKTKSSRRKAA